MTEFFETFGSNYPTLDGFVLGIIFTLACKAVARNMETIRLRNKGAA